MLFTVEDKQEAVEWYIKGINELEKGLTEECIGASQDDKSKVWRIQAKMKNTFAMAKERLEALCKIPIVTNTLMNI